MMNEIAELLDEVDDEALCDKVFCRFAKLNNSIDVQSYEEPERVVTLVWHACGIIGNGGFHYLLEGDFNGDPGFTYTAAAFKAIGAEDCYRSFQDVMRCFPDGRLPSDIPVRIARYESIPLSRRDQIDESFWAEESRDVPSLLARYIRQHRSEIARLLSRGRKTG
jgi:hypothetical protein